jgi:hypothetical protein
MTTDGRPTTSPAPEVAKAAEKPPTDPPIYSEAQAVDEAEEKPKDDPVAVPDSSTQGPDLVQSEQPDGG